MKSEDDMYEFIKPNEIEKIILEHRMRHGQLEEQAHGLLRSSYDTVISRMLLQVKFYLENLNPYKAAEQLYRQFEEFKHRYEAYIETLSPEDLPPIEDKKMIAAMFYGIENLLMDLPQLEENPIEYERMLIVSTNLLKIKELLNENKEELITRFKLPHNFTEDKIEQLEDYLRAILEEKFQRFYEQIDQASIEITDIERRKDLVWMVNLLREQQALLKNYIYITIDVEEPYRNDYDSGELTATYIYPIRQIYTELTSALSDMDRLYKKEIQRTPFELKNKDRLVEHVIYRMPRIKEVIELVEEDHRITKDEMLTHITDELRKISGMEMAQIKKKSNRFELLSFAILDTYEIGLGQIRMPTSLEGIEEQIIKVLKGIMDTLLLKYDCLKEKDTRYHLAKKEAYLTAMGRLIGFSNQFEKDGENFLQEAIHGDGHRFTEAGEAFLELVEEIAKEVEKEDMDFLSKELLPEMATFEDIIHQSVKHVMTKCDHPEIIPMMEEIRGLYNRLIKQIERQGITTIRPEVKERFEPKYHEVIVAENQEGYSKGEIIRRQNIGYHYEGYVLRRAGVIVAK